jgi:hypothetical protein
MYTHIHIMYMRKCTEENAIGRSNTDIDTQKNVLTRQYHCETRAVFIK